MKFVDEVQVTVESGPGGAGSVSFRREKFVPRGGPDGGDGGKGGSVILQGDDSLSTLIDFKLRPRLKAERGKGGSGRNKVGKSGEDLIVKVPFGTQVQYIRDYDPSTGTKELGDSGESENSANHHEYKLVGDITPANPTLKVARGGRGGKGNAFFKSATRQTPDFAQPGEPGEAFVLKLTLKLMADVGLVGFPNAGKSSLLGALSAAKPIVGSYPFTTLTPSLGVVSLGTGSHFVAADIPGLIEGAHQGKGLGIRFLKHLERTSTLLHLIDGSLAIAPDEYMFQSEIVTTDEVTDTPRKTPEQSMLEVFNTIQHELEQFSSRLKNLPQFVIVSKADLLPDPAMRNRIRKAFADAGQTEIMFVSSATRENIDSLKELCYERVKAQASSLAA